MRKIIGTLWNRITRNDINDNFEQLFGDVDNISGKITDEIMDEMRSDVKLNWKEAVETFGDLPSNAEIGDTHMVLTPEEGSNPIYRYNGNEWIKIQAFNATAITEAEDRLQSEIDEKETPDGAQDKADQALSDAKAYTDELETQIYDNDDVVKIVEKGNNSNGGYIRYSDGTQHCWHGISQIPNQSLGGIARSETTTWTYPKPFEVSPYHVSVSVNSYSRWGDIGGSPSKTSVSVLQFSDSTKSSSITTAVYAIGRWK